MTFLFLPSIFYRTSFRIKAEQKRYYWRMKIKKKKEKQQKNNRKWLISLMCLSKQTKSWDCSTALWSLVQVCHISIFVNFCFGINKAVIFLVGIISYHSCRVLLQGLRCGFKFSHCWRSCDGLSLLTTSSLQLWCRSGNHLTSPAGHFFFLASKRSINVICISIGVCFCM